MKALVLSGGGAKGAYQVGVLKRWMGDHEIDYDIMCGVSVGALNVAGLARIPKGQSRKAIQELENFWLTKITGTKSIHKRWCPFGALHALWLKSVYNSSPLIKLVKESLDLSTVMKNGRKISVGAVCLETGEHRYVDETDPNFSDWILASSSYPVFLKPIEIEGKHWSDGGVVNVTPLGKAIELGATEIDIVICSDPWAKITWDSNRKAAVPDQVIQVLNIMSSQIMKNDIQITGLKNDLSDINPKYKSVKIRVVFPKFELIKNPLEFNPEEIKMMMEQGYKDADNFIIYE